MTQGEEEFYTFRGYTLAMFERDALSPSMEDYLEMIYRLGGTDGFTRVNDVAQALNVQPPSVTRMVQRLSTKNLVKYEKYGVILLTELGKEVGKYLLERHNMLAEFLEIIGVDSRVLENVERIEHNLTSEATEAFSFLVSFFKDRPEIVKEFLKYRREKQSAK